MKVYAVSDCGAVTCLSTRKFMRATMLEFPLKPLLHIAFVSVSVYLLPFLLHRVSFVSSLTKLWLERLLMWL